MLCRRHPGCGGWPNEKNLGWLSASSYSRGPVHLPSRSGHGVCVAPPGNIGAARQQLFRRRTCFCALWWGTRWQIDNSGGAGDARHFYFVRGHYRRSRTRSNWEKQFLDLEGNTAKFETQDRPVAGIYIMEPRSEAPETPRIEEISTQRATIRLVQNTYMNYLLDREQRAREFDAIARLVSGVSVKLLKPSKHAARINDMCELLETDARSTCLRESR